MEDTGLKSYDWEVSYMTSGINREGKPVNILHDFYLPALERIVRYDRVAGYFRSTSLAAASQGYTRFLNNDGHMRLIVGADLAAEDVAAILSGDSKRMSDKLLAELDNEDSWPEEVKNGVALLSDMVAKGKLEVRVAFRVNANDGTPLSIDSVDDGYVHEKWFVMTDAEGNRIYGSGSLNESRTALTINAENITVICDWYCSKFEQAVNDVARKYDDFWNNRNPHMRVYPLPEAVRKKLIKLKNLRKKPTEIDWTEIDIPVELKPEELMKLAVLKDAPKMPNGIYIGMYSAPVEPWPHQEVVARRLVETYPYSYMMCDEVGLGKTIEAALAMRSLILSGRVKRVLVIAPAGLTDQWHRELADKAMLSFAKSKSKPGSTGYIISEWIYPYEKETQSRNLFEEDKNIVSSGLAQRNERQRQMDNSADFDIVFLDEAHYARRQNPNRHDEGAPEYGKLYKLVNDIVLKHTKALWLATATPMQIDSVEAYDLLRLAGRSGPFMDDPAVCMKYFNILGKLVEDKGISFQEWQFVGQSFIQIEGLDAYLWNFLKSTVIDGRNQRVLKNLYRNEPKSVDIKFLKQPLFSASPLSRVMQRHTRGLLEVYRREGKLKSNLARRIIRPIAAVPFNEAEKRFYESLEDYCNELKKQLRSNNSKSNQVLRFYLNFLQLRFASSLYAIERSLKNRLKKVKNTLRFGGQTFESEEELKEALQDFVDMADNDDGYDEADFDDISLKVLFKDRTVNDLEWEQERLEEMLSEIKKMNETPSKIKRLLSEIEERKSGGRVKQFVLFTRFYDTLKSIRNYLLREPSLRVGVYSGKKVSWYDEEVGKDVEVSRETVKQLFLEGKIDILLCTDAAAEGLNLQTADLLINFDLGWNPMKIEQRIGRIDRIGQKYQEIYVLNMCYLDSTEEIVYGRLLTRLAQANIVVGSQQISMLPIGFEDFRKLQDKEITEEELAKEAKNRLKREQEQVASMEMSAEDIYSIYNKLSGKLRDKKLPASIEDMWDTFSSSEYLKEKYFNIDGDRLIRKNNFGVSDIYIVNRDNYAVDYKLLTWGSELADSIFKDVETMLDENRWIRRIEVSDDVVSLVGYVIAVSDGFKLVTAFSDLKNLSINTSAVVTKQDLEPFIEEMQSYLREESSIYRLMKNTLLLNREYAEINSAFIRYAASGLLNKLASDCNFTYCSEAMKYLSDNPRKTYTVNLPKEKFHEKSSKLLFMINDSELGTSVKIRGSLLEIVIKCIARELNGSKKKRSEITIEELAKKLENPVKAD